LRQWSAGGSTTPPSFSPGPQKLFDGSDQIQKGIMDRMQSKHTETLQLAVPLADRELLKSKIDELSHRITLVESGGGNLLTHEMISAMSVAEVRGAGIDLVNRSLAMHPAPVRKGGQ